MARGSINKSKIASPEQRISAYKRNQRNKSAGAKHIEKALREKTRRSHQGAKKR